MSQAKDILGKAPWIRTLACLICACFCSIQLHSLLGEFFTPTRTHTYNEEIHLQNIDFPIDIKICVTPGMDQTALEYFGYSSYKTFIAGISRFNYSLIGWGGHTNQSNAGMSSAKEVLEAVRTNGIDSLSSITLVTSKGFFIFNSSDLNLRRQNMLSDCHIWNMRKVENITGRGVKWIGIKFNDIVARHNFSVGVHLQGHTLASRRNIIKHNFHHSGDQINEFSSHYVVEIKNRIFSQEDPSNSCQNYPNNDFATYKECDAKFTKDTFTEIVGGLNVTPPWITDNIDSVTGTAVPWFNISRRKYGRG